MSNFETFKLHFGVLELKCHVAITLKLWCGLLLSSSLHGTECVSRQFTYLNPLYNPAAQGNWPHSLSHSLSHLLTITYLQHRRLLHTWRQLCGPYLEEFIITLTRFIWLQTIQGNLCWMYLEICIPIGKLKVESSNFPLIYSIICLLFKF